MKKNCLLQINIPSVSDLNLCSFAWSFNNNEHINLLLITNIIISLEIPFIYIYFRGIRGYLLHGDTGTMAMFIAYIFLELLNYPLYPSILFCPENVVSFYV